MTVLTKILAILSRAWTWVRNWFTAADEALPRLGGLTPMESQHMVTSLMMDDMIRDRRSERRWKIFRRTTGAIGIALALGYYAVFYASTQGLSLNTSTGKFLGVVRVQGNIMQTSLASSEKIVPSLKAAFEDPSVKAVVLAIDSGGGAPLEAERITYTIETLKKKHNKPVYAVVQNLGASAAYMIAMHSDQIYAGRYSLVGSIGAVMSSWDVHKAINKYDVYQQVFASGELKAMLNPFIAPTEAARTKAQQLVDKAGAIFYAEMRKSRGDKLKPDVKYNTGEIWDGEQALAIGLIDGLATIEEIADRNEAEVKEFGPGQRTVTPFATSFSGELSAWLSNILTNAFRTSLEEQATPGLR